MQIKSIQIETLAYPCKLFGDLTTTPPIVFLHGWPATNAMWNELMHTLFQEGYPCLAPPLRGFHENACPQGKEHYTIDKVAQDVMQVLDKLGIDQFHLVGHDWGGWVGWILATMYPDRILTWTAISVPHMKAFSHAYQHDKTQYKMSFYMRQFRLPWLPEWALSRKDLKALREIWKDLPFELSHKFSQKFEQKNILTASLNYYRANFNYLTTGTAEQVPNEKVNVPTLYIWGTQDPAVSALAAQKTHEYVDGYYKIVELESAHWPVQEKAQEVFAALLEHFNNGKKQRLFLNNCIE